MRVRIRPKRGLPSFPSPEMVHVGEMGVGAAAAAVKSSSCPLGRSLLAMAGGRTVNYAELGHIHLFR